MTGGKKGGGAKPPSRPLIDAAARWNLYLTKRAEVEKAFRETLKLPADLDLSRFAQPFAMAALPPLDESAPPRRPGRATPQQVRRALLRIEATARGAIQARPRKNAAELLRAAINNAPDEVKAALPGAVVMAALLPDLPHDRIARLAADAGLIAATIPAAPHPGGRRPAMTNATALAILLAQSYETLTGNRATVNNRDLDDAAIADPSPFMLLAEQVFEASGLVRPPRKGMRNKTGSPRKAAERAVKHLKATRNDRDKNANE